MSCPTRPPPRIQTRGDRKVVDRVTKTQFIRELVIYKQRKPLSFTQLLIYLLVSVYCWVSAFHNKMSVSSLNLLSVIKPNPRGSPERTLTPSSRSPDKPSSRGSYNHLLISSLRPFRSSRHFPYNPLSTVTPVNPESGRPLKSFIILYTRTFETGGGYHFLDPTNMW